jgi:hypothetical protein
MKDRNIAESILKKSAPGLVFRVAGCIGFRV